MANPIESKTGLARAVGILAGRWGQAEFSVETIFLTLSGAEPRKATIFFSYIKNVPTQRELLKFMLRETPGISDPTRKELKAALAEYQRLAPLRNSVIHYPFGIDPKKKTKRLYKAKRLRSGPELYVRDPTSPKAIMGHCR